MVRVTPYVEASTPYIRLINKNNGVVIMVIIIIIIKIIIIIINSYWTRFSKIS